MIESFCQAASVLFDYFFQTSPSYFSLFLHLDLAFISIINIIEASFSIESWFFIRIWNGIVSFNNKENSVSAEIFFSNYYFTLFDTFYLEAVNCSFDILLGEFLEEFRSH